MHAKRKQGIQNTFDLVATGYDHPALSFFPQTAQLIIEHLQPNNDDTLLDVCTGTGVVALSASQAIKQGKITGIDLSNGMLQQARQKATEQQIDNIHFCQMDLDQMALPEQHFDMASCSFGLFFLEDMLQGLRNIRHCLKPNAKIAISTFTEGSFQPLSNLFVEQYTTLGYQAPGLSWERLDSDATITELFHEAGFNNINIHHHKLGFDLNTEQDWWDVVWNAGYRGLFEQLTDEEKVNFKQQQMDSVRQRIQQGDNHMEINVAVVVAEREG